MATTYIYDSVDPDLGFDRYELGTTAYDLDPQYREDLEHILDTGDRAEKYLYSYSESGAHTTAGLGVRDGNGKVVAVVGVEKPMTILESARSTYVKQVAFIATMVVLLTIAGYLFWLNNILIAPIAEITGEARRFADNSRAPSRPLKAVKSHNEIGILAISIQKMEQDINRYIDNLTKVTAEKERIGAELDIATNIQKSMLPSIFPAFPDRKELDVYATMNPAKEVGGDFYDFFMVDDDHLAIVMADVSGKGIPAALFMVIGKTLIKDYTQPDRDLGEVFSQVNDLLCESNSEGLFITAFEGVLDLVTGEFRYVNAGHEIPFICKKGGVFEPYPIKAGFVLAGMEGMRYKCGSMQLEPGNKVFQYTDGVTEATNSENELYGMGRLGRILEKHSELSPEKLLPMIKEDIDAFVDGAPQFDDITMLCLEYKEKKQA